MHVIIIIFHFKGLLVWTNLLLKTVDNLIRHKIKNDFIIHKKAFQSKGNHVFLHGNKFEHVKGVGLGWGRPLVNKFE